MGLRESKKQQTRDMIAGEAMRLFVIHGFDRVTVAEIAAAASVSEKTVFNYFPTKEDLFFDEVPEREAALVETVSGCRTSEQLLEALHRAQSEQCSRLASPGFVAFARMIDESAALQVKELAVMAHFAEVLAGAIRAELGADERDARLAAGLLISVHWQLFRTARKQALAGKHGPGAVRRLRAELDRAYQLLQHGLRDLHVTETEAASGYHRS